MLAHAVRGRWVNRMSSCVDRRIFRVMELLKRDLSQKHSLDEAARTAGLSPTYLSRRFRELQGVTFSDWAARTRVEEAKRLLRIIDLPITVIAISVGYCDPTTFARAFRRYEGLSPRQYRAICRRSTD